MPGGSEAPRWSLQTIYPSFDSPEYRRDRELLEQAARRFLDLLKSPGPQDEGEAARWLGGLIRSWEDAGNLVENLKAYAEALYTVDTRESRPLAEINALEAAILPLKRGEVLFRSRLAEREALIRRLIETDETLKPYGFFIREALKEAAFQMGADLEDLANDLARSGGDAWERLHGAISSTAGALWDPATGERKTVIALRNLAMSPDRGLRERAFHAELEAWKSVEIPLAAALNGVKGTALTLDIRRGWQAAALASVGTAVPGAAVPKSTAAPENASSLTALEKSAFQAHLGGKTLGALIAALEASLPLFRRYLKAKAALLGLPVCAFYDLFAPVGKAAGKTWAWEEATAFIAERFDGFDPGMGAFARYAASSSWIDAQGREGKVGGAYCIAFPLAGETRILCNFEGSFSSVTTVAHELGHAWHAELLKDLPRSRVSCPMTLAETASIFAETIVFEGALTQAGPEDRLSLIEGNLKDSCQVMVDILSRFYFERNLFDRRGQGELSPGELCELMKAAQEKTYGDGLDSRLLHPYMWAVKSHYYGADLAFYNYPYAFGLLFSLGLYARYQKEGPGFAAAYRELLRLTGQATVEEVARSAGFNLEGEEFWREGLSIIRRRVEDFEALAAVPTAVVPKAAPAKDLR